MSDGFYPITLENWPSCGFKGCINNKEGKCHSGLIAFRIETRIITEDFNCTGAIVPYNTCDFCGAELEEVEGCKTCPNGCF